MQCIINQPVKIPFTSIGLTTGKTVFATTYLLNGVVTTSLSAITFTEIGGGLYTINFTPTTSGTLSLFIENTLLPSIDVVSKDIYTFLQNIEDESLGTWSWDKVAGRLSMLRQNGTALASFNVVDTISTASRERIG